MKNLKACISVFVAVFMLLPASAHVAECQVCDLEEMREEIYRGLDNALRAPCGLLYTNTQEKAFLSESVGLEMLVAVNAGDRRSFDRQMEMVKTRFLGSLGLMYWKLKENMEPDEPWNASLDDLRVARALILAHDLWGEQAYLDLALSIGDAVLEYNVKDNVLVDGCSWKKGVTGKVKVADTYEISTLAYVDVLAMELLAEHDPRWMPVLQRSWGVLAAGVSGRDLPMWLYDHGEAMYDDKSPEDEAIGKMMALSYMAEGGFIPLQAAEHVRRVSLTGSLTDKYGNENISVIALMSLFLNNAGFRGEAMNKACSLSEFRMDSPGIKGLLGYEESEGCYSAWTFDNLLTLLAIDALLQSD